jgi:glutamine synthetase
MPTPSPKPVAARWVRLTFVDVFGTSNSVQLPAQHFDDAVAHGAMFDGSSLQGRSRALEADMLLRPDPATLFSRGDVARVSCTVCTTDGTPWRADPRTALVGLLGADGQIADLAAAWTSAAELELYLLDDGVPIDRSSYFDDCEGRGMEVTRRAADELIGAGLDVVSCHHEAGPSQYEIDLAPLPPLALADALVLASRWCARSRPRRGCSRRSWPVPSAVRRDQDCTCSNTSTGWSRGAAA